jgi:trans-2,3-dihydro-3-hydroxyanthranilate isomerase
MRLSFVTVDVFTDRQFGGNPLAVVLNAEGLSDQQMQAIAAEFNLSETTFVLPSKAPDDTAQVRIFTPRAEMPFAGHPNVGTAFVLAREGECYGRPIAGDTLVFEELAGLVRMELTRKGPAVTGARLAAPQKLVVSDTVTLEVVSEACGIPIAAIETNHHQPCIASCGAPFVIAELKERRALAAARPYTEVFAQHLPKDLVAGIHLYVQNRDEIAEIHARMFAPLHGIAEDPATGSANVALIGLLARLRPEPGLRLTKSIAQGFDMGRPSLLRALAEKQAGAVTATYIEGSCVAVMRGFLDLA